MTIDLIVAAPKTLDEAVERYTRAIADSGFTPSGSVTAVWQGHLFGADDAYVFANVSKIRSRNGIKIP